MSAPVLELDLGNSRIKWRLLGAGDDGVRAVEHDAFASSLVPPPLGVRVRAVSVAGPARDASCVAALAAAGYPAPVFARTTSQLGSVTNGYLAPERLGTDRWLAIVAAAALTDASCVVVDAGSAVTVDVVDAGGVHAGGWIVPGLALMRESLRRGTAGVRPEASSTAPTAPGRDTTRAVEGGVRLMVADFVLGRWRALCDADGDAGVILTGGDADLLEPLLRPVAGDRLWIAPTLVLDALATAVP